MLQTCQPLVKENLETHGKKSGDSTKNSEILFFFPDQAPSPSRELDTKIIPRAYSPYKMADRRGEKRKVIEALNTSKNHSSVQKSIKSTVFFVIGLSLYGTSIPHKYCICIQHFNLLPFRKIFFQKPWDWEPCRETVRNDKKSWDSRKTVRVGRSDVTLYKYSTTENQPIADRNIQRTPFIGKVNLPKTSLLERNSWVTDMSHHARKFRVSILPVNG